MTDVYSFLKNAEDPDKDHRFMACSDLLAEVQKPTWKPPQGDECTRLLDKVLQRLNDASGDISALAVKWCAAPGHLVPAKPMLRRSRESACCSPPSATAPHTHLCMNKVAAASDVRFMATKYSVGAPCTDGRAAARSIVALAATVPETHAKKLLLRLCQGVTRPRAKATANADAACICLKAVAAELPAAQGPLFAATSAPTLLQGLPPQVRA
jgi:hypothetical protein